MATPNFTSVTTAAKLSGTRDTEVSYDFPATVSVTLLAGQSVTATLSSADDAAMTVNVLVVSSKTTENHGVLNLSQTNTLNLSGWVLANRYRKVTFSVTNSAVAPTTMAAGWEVTQ